MVVGLMENCFQPMGKSSLLCFQNNADSLVAPPTVTCNLKFLIVPLSPLLVIVERHMKHIHILKNFENTICGFQLHHYYICLEVCKCFTVSCVIVSFPLVVHPVFLVCSWVISCSSMYWEIFDIIYPLTIFKLLSGDIFVL